MIQDWDQLPDTHLPDNLPVHMVADAPEDDLPASSAGAFAPDENADTHLPDVDRG